MADGPSIKICKYKSILLFWLVMEFYIRHCQSNTFTMCSLTDCLSVLWLEMGPDPTRAYFWPAVNKRLACLWPGYFFTQPQDVFLIRREKIEKFDNFSKFSKFKPKPKMAYPTQPEPQKIDPTHHYLCCLFNSCFSSFIFVFKVNKVFLITLLFSLYRWDRKLSLNVWFKITLKFCFFCILGWNVPN